MNAQTFRAGSFLRHPADSFADHGAARTCNLTYIKHALGRGDYGDKRMVTYVTLLISGEGFPRPLPTLRKSALTAAVTAESRWLRDAVDAWLHDFLPPEAGAALDAAAQAAAASAMDHAAAALGRGKLKLVGGSEA